MGPRARSLVGLAAAVPAAAAAVLLLADASRAPVGRAGDAGTTRPMPHALAPTASRASPPAREKKIEPAPRETRADERADERDGKLSALIARDPAAAIRSIVERVLSAPTEVEKAEALLLLTDEQALATRPEVAGALAEIAAVANAVSARASAIRMLGELPGESAERLEKLVALGRADASPEVRVAAANALATVAERSPGDLARQASRSLVESLAQESDAEVRASLLGSIRDTRDPAVVTAVATALSSESPEGRDAAAFVLGSVSAAQRGRALEALANRFSAEPDDEVRRTILASIVRTGRSDAGATLRTLRSGAGALTQDVDDYVAILASGEDDPVKVAALKDAREGAR